MLKPKPYHAFFYSSFPYIHNNVLMTYEGLMDSSSCFCGADATDFFLFISWFSFCEQKDVKEISNGSKTNEPLHSEQ